MILAPFRRESVPLKPTSMEEMLPEVLLLCLCAGDPNAPRPFSGSARALFSALRRLGCLHATANVLGWSDSFEAGPLPVRMLRKLDRFGLEDWYHWSPLNWKRNSRRAREAMEAHPGFNAVLMYGTTYSCDTDVPCYVYLDATSAQVAAAKAWEFAHFSREKTRQVVQYQQRIFDHCSAVFPRSEWTADSLREDYHLPESKIVVTGAGSNFGTTPLPHKGYDEQRILFIGIEWERKGGPLILEAFRKLRRSMPEVKLVIIGCDPGITEPGVEVVGRLQKSNPAEMQRLLDEYSRASVFCMMSHYEPFGIVVLEAQECGVPCVVPDRFAFGETVRHGETGMLVPEYDAQLLAMTFAELLSEPAKLERMGAAAKEWVAAQWTWDHAARTIRDRVAADLAARGATAATPKAARV